MPLSVSFCFRQKHFCIILRAQFRPKAEMVPLSVDHYQHVVNLGMRTLSNFSASTAFKPSYVGAGVTRGVRCDQLWPDVTRCVRSDQMWPGMSEVTRCDKGCKKWPGVTKGVRCDQLWPDVTRGVRSDQVWPGVSDVTRCDQSDKSTFLLNHNRRRSIMWVFHLVQFCIIEQ